MARSTGSFQKGVRRSQRLIGFHNSDACVPVSLLAAELNRHKKQLQDDYVPMRGKGSNYSHDDFNVPDTAWLELLSMRAERYSSITKESIRRRLFDVMNERKAAISVELADALVMACGTTLIDAGIPSFPTSIRAAREMVAVYHEVRRPDDPITEIEAEQLARHLMRFSQDFILGKEPPIQGPLLANGELLSSTLAVEEEAVAA